LEQTKGGGKNASYKRMTIHFEKSTRVFLFNAEKASRGEKKETTKIIHQADFILFPKKPGCFKPTPFALAISSSRLSTSSRPVDKLILRDTSAKRITIPDSAHKSY